MPSMPSQWPRPLSHIPHAQPRSTPTRSTTTPHNPCERRLMTPRTRRATLTTMALAAAWHLGALGTLTTLALLAALLTGCTP